jgi:ATPase subunit of ABC transporter with duplicated ATPase domains
MAKKKQPEGYLSAKEVRAITKQNRKITGEMEKKWRRKNVPESEYLTQMRDPANAVEFDDLHTYFFTDSGTVKSVDGVSFDVPIGKTVGVVGESGCGKSVTSLSLMQLLQRPQGQIVSGQIRLNRGEKAYDIAQTPQQDFARKRLADEIRRSFAESERFGLHILVTGQKYDRHLPELRIRLQLPKHLKTAHLRHMHVQKDDIRHIVSRKHRKRFLPASAHGSLHACLAENPVKHFQTHQVIIDDQYLFFLTHRTSSCSVFIILYFPPPAYLFSRQNRFPKGTNRLRFCCFKMNV